jgi:DNA invertase Pin-like site-specific DNA recombinase
MPFIKLSFPYFLTDLFNKSVKKYGKDNFINGILEFCDYDCVLEKEKEWIFKMNTISPLGYNLTFGGEGCVGYKHTTETMKKLVGRKMRQESKLKMSIAKKGKKINYKKIINQNTKDKISFTLTDFEKKNRILELYENGKSINEIKILLKCSSKTIIKSIKNNFDKRSWCYYRENKLKDETKKKLSDSHLKLGENKRKEIEKLYIIGKTYKEIIKELNCSPSTISRIVKNNKLKKTNHVEHYHSGY